MQQVLETELFSPIDSRAAIALAHMEETGEPPNDTALRRAWSQFVVSLIHRTPRAIERLKTRYATVSDEIVAAISDAYPAIRTAEHPPTAQEYLEQQAPEFYAELTTRVTAQLVSSEAVCNTIEGMIWGLGASEEGHHGLLTCDSPVLMSNGLTGNAAFLLLPIGPRRFFIAAQHAAVIEAFNGVDAKKIEGAINDGIVRQGRELVIGQTVHQRRFIDNRLHVASPPENDGGFLYWNVPTQLIDWHQLGQKWGLTF